ncbi:hypothetical protein [Trujillonella endophytica]|uniref:Uncharacterized protein n=1 Tax=Trujillonella endophytica TaxID=673521 RepID=A0A1H8TDL5_9ACTN|nr:hypothetical protein [Trujillella endophytica]SEO89037.1 hypothetical protein SAMN05660991_02161 [Trujillella endophytica]
MSENDPDPTLPDEGQGRAELGGEPMPTTGDPTRGGRTGQIGDAPSITGDEPDDGGPPIPVGGGDVREEQDAPPVAGTGPES